MLGRMKLFHVSWKAGSRIRTGVNKENGEIRNLFRKTLPLLPLSTPAGIVFPRQDGIFVIIRIFHEMLLAASCF